MSGKIIAFGAAGIVGLSLVNAFVPVTERQRNIKRYLSEEHLDKVRVTGRGSYSDCANSLFNYPIKTRFEARAESGAPVTGVVCRAWGVKPRIEYN